jgi:thioesterase domain-containing protein
MPTSPADLTDYLHREIPLTRAMGMAATSWDGQTVTLHAPLAPNENHADTAFGGSIASMAFLAGYGLLYLIFQERGLSTRILIQKSAIEFLRPVDADLVATACCPPPADLEAMVDTLRRKRRARMTIESQVLSGKTVAATQSGVYVALIY